MFQDRQDAGRALAERLQQIDPKLSVILALPRGGVTVAQEVCDATGAPLDLIIVRKVGTPGQRELAVGAIADGGSGADSNLVINQDVAAMCGLSDEEVRDLAKAEEPELERRRQAYLGTRRPIELGGKTAIIVDDGIATGATMRAAIKSARSRRAAKVVVAVPVAAQETIDELRPLVDDIICLATPSPFWAVGQHYADFPQVSDEAVVEALSAHRAPDEA